MMTKLLPWLRRATALATIALAAVMCWQCMEIYAAGMRPENLDANGARIAQIYTREAVSQRLSALLLPAAGYAALIAVTAWVGRKASERQPARKTGRRTGMRAGLRPQARLWVRLSLYAAAIAFIVLGVMNGGLRDVLVKAIMICTECIGLG